AAAKLIKSKGAIIVISGPTPREFWDSTNTKINDSTVFQAGAKKAAELSGSYFVNHFDSVAQVYEALGKTKVDTFYTRDHSHTTPEGAFIVAKSYIRAAISANNVFKPYLSKEGMTAVSANPTALVSSSSKRIFSFSNLFFVFISLQMLYLIRV
ncbi:hypothetical protein HK096_004889, partial [Nowakowskiella sp. JEL0078]